MIALRQMLSSWTGRVVVAFLLVQLLLPLRYYLWHRDPHDERFAWRMFSPMRMATCEARFTVDDQPVRILGQFHEAWLELANRGRFVVLEAMAARLCGQRAGVDVHLTLTCRYMDGSSRTYGGRDMCIAERL
ncbi:MAG: hypothetical protein KBG28_20010 [Kofleriaceae bacterium]|nr:hypothetical protein [Kofleriaceae bacterium]MBP6836628.1 hypothetical protein [Kofleriaceae bacterium]MBP9206268.1 hypothetical protein [Kofleriaceae bacterium]